MSDLREFYNGKKVFITGHSGFKGSWMSFFLHSLGAQVQGYSLEPDSSDNLFYKTSLSQVVNHLNGDILDIDNLKDAINSFSPEIVFHFAAQPLVIESYKRPRYTWEVNVIGTLNLLECLKESASVKSIVIVTTDKVYKNLEKKEGYSEEEKLGGFDPYSSSKAAVEILVASMYDSFFKSKNIGLATARSGNVVGGGDWAENRLIPDYYRSLHKKVPFELRNPSSVRPWQHVLDVLNGYSILGMKLYNDALTFSKAWNFGPTKNNITTKEIIERLNRFNNLEVFELISKESEMHETRDLRLNSDMANSQLDWRNILTIDDTLNLVDYFYSNYFKINPQQLMKVQLMNFFKLIES